MSSSIANTLATLRNGAELPKAYPDTIRRIRAGRVLRSAVSEVTENHFRSCSLRMMGMTRSTHRLYIRFEGWSPSSANKR